MIMKPKLSPVASLISAILALLLSLQATAELVGPPEGRQQLVDALDAAWVRALDEGQVREIINRHDASDLVINIADCLPDPEVTRFPENPVGTLKRILDEQRIKVGHTNTGRLDEGSTAIHFTEISNDLINALLARIAEHYGSGPIEVVMVSIPPPFLNTSYIDSGKADMLGLVNALGGSTKDDKRRRKARRYTCTMTATPQFVWMLKDGGPDWKNIDDALNARDVHFCAGPLSNELTKTFFDQPGQSTKTEFVADLATCLPKLVKGEADAMISPLPHERYFPKYIDTDGDGKAETATAGLFRSFNTMIVAGTPLWVAVD